MESAGHLPSQLILAARKLQLVCVCVCKREK